MALAYKPYLVSRLSRLFIQRSRIQRPMDLEKSLEQRTLVSILEAVRQIRFGSVEIVIHDGRIVAIEKREKLRLEKDLGHRA